MIKPRIVLLIFVSGKVVLTGNLGIVPPSITNHLFDYVSCGQCIESPSKVKATCLYTQNHTESKAFCIFVSFNEPCKNRWEASIICIWCITQSGLECNGRTLFECQLNIYWHGTWDNLRQQDLLQVLISSLFLGAKVRGEIYEAFENIYPILKGFRKTT